MKEDGKMILCLMATALLSLQRWRLEGLDKDSHEVLFDSGAYTSSDFIQ
jgi:hypothetical protein